MSKRVVAGALWFMAGSYLGGYVAYSVGLSDMLAPLTGALGALLIAGDPFKVIWRDALREDTRRPAAGGAMPLAHDGSLAHDG